MNRLNRLSVRGFKSIRELDLELDNVNVLIGGNGAGKSNLLSLLRMLRSVATRGLQEWVARAGGAKSVLHYGPKVTPALEVSLELQAGSDAGSYRARLASSPSDTLVFLEEAFGIASQGAWQLNAARSEGLIEDYAANGDPAACADAASSSSTTPRRPRAYGRRRTSTTTSGSTATQGTWRRSSTC